MMRLTAASYGASYRVYISQQNKAAAKAELSVQPVMANSI